MTTEDVHNLLPRTWADDIATFHSQLGVNDAVEKLHGELLAKYLKFRLDMCQEELDEAFSAFHANDAAEVVDALIDCVVFCIGTLNVFDVDAQKAWHEVYKANIVKSPGIKTARPNPWGLPDMIKPNGWTAPDHGDNVGRLPEALAAKSDE